MFKKMTKAHGTRLLLFTAGTQQNLAVLKGGMLKTARNIAVHYGYRRLASAGGGGFAHHGYAHPDGHTLLVHTIGTWRHQHPDGRETTGEDSASLFQHLHQTHGGAIQKSEAAMDLPAEVHTVMGLHQFRHLGSRAVPGMSGVTIHHFGAPDHRQTAAIMTAEGKVRRWKHERLRFGPGGYEGSDQHMGEHLYHLSAKLREARTMKSLAIAKGGAGAPRGERETRAMVVRIGGAR